MPDIVTLDEAAEYLRITPKTESADEKLLQGCISAATPLIEEVIGPTVSRRYLETYDGGAATIQLLHLPLVEVLSITEYIGTAAYALTAQPLGSQTSSYGYTINPITQSIERRTFGGGPALFLPGEGNIIVEYIAGYASIPPDVKFATLALVKHLYETTLPKARSSRSDYDDGALPLAAGFAMPSFVTELLQPRWQGPGIA